MEPFDLSEMLATIDTKRKKRITVSLIDPNGVEVPLKEAVRKISDFIVDKLSMESDEPNALVTRIMPLILQSMGAGLPRVIQNDELAHMVCAISGIRWSAVMVGMISFSLLQFIQKKNLKIITKEQDLTDEEVERTMRLSHASDEVAIQALSGANPAVIIREMINNGMLSPDDVEGLDLDQEDDDLDII